MKAVCFYLVLLAGIVYASETVDKEETIGLLDNGEEVVISSVNYPEDAPANLRQTWKLTAPEGFDINLECNDIRLYEETPCGDWALTFTYGDNKEEICTVKFDFNKTFETNNLEIKMRTGGADRGFLNCKAKAVKK